jgi:Zn-finger nucleic acid-binding protein
MNCRNCGGAMELFASRGYFFCRYCGSFHFPDSAGDDGIKVLGASEGSLSCIVCDKPLSAALMDGAHPVRYCSNCRGVLLARTAFAAVVQKRRAWATDPPAPPVPFNAADLDRNVRCPACKVRMTTHPYYGPGNVVMDSCAACDLVWLDFGELKQIVGAPGSDRGSREVVARDRTDLASKRWSVKDGPDAIDAIDLFLDLF